MAQKWWMMVDDSAKKAQLKRASPSGVKSVSESIRGLLAQEFCLQKFVKTFWQVRKITTMYGTDDGSEIRQTHQLRER